MPVPAVFPIHICRVYQTLPPDGARLLVDRLWPRGVAKAKLNLDDWIHEVAPSDELRHWFGHLPERWDGFRTAYRAELAANPAAVERCLDWCRKGPVVLLYAARDEERNNAVVLAAVLAERDGT